MKSNSLEKAINYNNIIVVFCKVSVMALSNKIDQNPIPLAACRVM